MNKIALVIGFVGIFLLNGCVSTSQPTSKVGIVNGKYAIQTVVPNNNKGKKVDLLGGQSYYCLMNKKKSKLSFNLRVSEDGKKFTAYNMLTNGKKNKNAPSTDIYRYKKGYAYVDTRSGAMLFNPKNNSGKVAWLPKKMKIKKMTKDTQAAIFQCVQTTNNSYTNTRYLTRDEISAYQHNQQIAVQKKAIDSANYNAMMTNLQAQSAQANYNTQQSLNRMNTYNVNVRHYY